MCTVEAGHTGGGQEWSDGVCREIWKGSFSSDANTEAAFHT